MKSFRQIQEECLTELSKTTLGSYVNKATTRSTTSAFKQGMNHQETGKFNEKAMRKLDSRKRGIARAVGKMVKEDNLQKTTLK